MKLTIREDAASALSLMEEVMRNGEPLAPDYPLVFEEGRPGRVAVAEEGGEILSTCALLERGLVHPGASVRIGLIGSVSTAARHRGRGLATAVLECAEQELLARGCLLAMLWADDPRFYEGRSYRAVGAETDFGLPADLAPRLPAAAGVRPASPADRSSLHPLYANHERRAERTEGETVTLLGSPGMKVVVHESAGRIDAYACLGRGHDLAGVVHEWGGRPDGVLACLRALLEARPAEEAEDALYLMAPLPAGEVGDRLTELGAPFAPGILGMGKLLDAPAAARHLAQAAAEPVRVEVDDAGTFQLRGPSGNSRVESPDLLTLLFSPRGERDALGGVERRLGTRFPSLPWTPFLWGLDSI